MLKTAKLFTYFILVFLFCLLRQTANASDVAINEIAWAGTTEGWQNEWIELFNGANEAIDISGWQIENGASSNKTLILSSGAMPANGYFLVCRQEMTSCDLIETKLSLHNEYNKNGQLALRDSANNLIDATPLPDGAAWLGGNNETKQTMERGVRCTPDPICWQTSDKPNGTPKATNSAIEAPETLIAPLLPPEPPIQTEPDVMTEPTPKPEPAPELEPQPATYPAGIYINEMLPSPEGLDAEEEWIELYNANDFEVDLSFWQIQDRVGQVRTYTFPNGIEITPFGFLLCPRTKTNITLQNSGDTIELLNPNQEIVYSIDYSKAPKAQSYNKTSEAWVWSTTLTPNKANVISQPETPKIATISNQQQKTKAGQNNTSPQLSPQEKALADISQTLPQSSSRLLIFIIAAIIAIGSAIVVLLLKQKGDSDG